MNTNNIATIWNSGFGPLGELRREVDRLFDDYWGAKPTARSFQNTEPEWAPACDIEEDENHCLVTLDMPGVQKDHLKIEVVDNLLTISGERRHEHQKKTDGLWYSERRQGKFQRTFTLPVGVDVDKVEANYQDGTLRVYVPKAESAKPRQIEITNGNGAGFFARLIGQSSVKEKEERHSPNIIKKDKMVS